MTLAVKALGGIVVVSLGLVVGGCSSSSPSAPSSSPAAPTPATVTSLAVVCPKLEASLKSLPTGSVSNDQIAAYITTLRQYKAEVPPSEQSSITGMIDAYQQLLDASTQAASEEAQAKVVAAAAELTAACAAATQNPG